MSSSVLDWSIVFVQYNQSKVLFISCNLLLCFLNFDFLNICKVMSWLLWCGHSAEACTGKQDSAPTEVTSAITLDFQCYKGWFAFYQSKWSILTHGPNGTAILRGWSFCLRNFENEKQWILSAIHPSTTIMVWIGSSLTTHESDPEIVKLLHFGQQLLSNLEWAITPFLTENLVS